MLMIIPIPWVTAWTCAMILHESLHCISLYLLGYSVLEVSFTANGARIVSEHTTLLHGMLCSLAGPIGSLLITPFLTMFPRVSVCVWIQSAFNLLPVYPLDGGQVLYNFFSCFTNNRLAEQLSNIISWSTIVMIAGVSITASVWLKLGITPLLIPVFLFLKTQRVKIPCKEALHRVQ